MREKYFCYVRLLLVLVITLLAGVSGVTVTYRGNEGFVLHTEKVYASSANLAVDAAVDDAREYGDGTRDYSSGFLYLYSNTNSTSSDYRCMALKFDNVDISSTATVIAANVTLELDYSNDPNCDIYLEKSDSPVDFATNTSIIARPRTAESVEWDVTNVGDALSQVTTVDFSAVLQELIESDVWDSGDSVVVLFIAKTDKNTLSEFHSYDWYTSRLGITFVDYTPVVSTTDYADNITSTSGDISANLTSLGGSPSVNVTFDWGYASDNLCYETSNQTKSSVGTYSSSLTSLTGNSTVYYKAVAYGSLVGYGDVKSFKCHDAPTSGILFTAEELAELKTRKGESSYLAIKAWADGNLTSTLVDPSSLLTVNASAGATSITVVDGSKFQAGRWYQIQERTRDGSAIHSEDVSPSSVVGNVINFASGITYSYNTTGHARFTPSWGGGGYGWFSQSDAVRRYLETMSFMYFMTSDVRYADAGLSWLESMTTWDSWNAFANRQFQAPSRLSMGVAIGYDAFKYYMGSSNLTALRNKILLETSHNLINDYRSGVTSVLASNAAAGQDYVEVASSSSFWVGQLVTVMEGWNKKESQLIESIAGNNLTLTSVLANSYTTAGSANCTTVDDGVTEFMSSATPNWKGCIGGAVGILSVSLGSYAPAMWTTHAQYYVDQMLTDVQWDTAVQGLPPDGSWFEGEHYFKYGFDPFVYYADTLKRAGGRDYIAEQTTYLSSTARWHAFMTYNGRGIAMGDASWTVGLNDASSLELPFEYWLAKTFSDGYAQQYADTYCDQSVPASFIWRDPDVTPLALSGYGLVANFAGGYTFWKSDWSNNGTLIVFKDATSATHAHTSSGEFQIYYNGKPVTGAATYLLNSWEILYAFNVFTEGDNFTEGGYTFPGFHQVKEAGDFGTVNRGYHGVITANETASNYYYVAGTQTGSANLTNPYTNDHTDATYKRYWTGNIDLWTRQLVYFPALNALVVFDRVGSDASTRYNMQYTAMDNCGSESINMTISGDNVTVVKNGGTVTPANVTSRLIMVDPVAANRTTEVVDDDGGGDIAAWKYLKVTNSVNSTSEIFTNVVYPNSGDSIVPSRVATGNCSGVIITKGVYKYLALFSNTGGPVDEWVELGDLYKAADGRTYTFSGTQIKASFSSYGAMLLEDADIALPTVVTLQESNVGEVTSTGSGNITNTGGENCTSRGFDWDVDSGAPYSYSETESGDFEGGSYSLSVDQLPAGSGVYLRAKATNRLGTGYGSEIYFKSSEWKYDWMGGVPAMTYNATSEWAGGVLNVHVYGVVAGGAVTPDISNAPAQEAIGLVQESSTYYAYGSAPSNPVTDGNCTFSITNNSGAAVDLDIRATDWTGGVGWTLTSGAPGVNQARMTAYYSGQDPSAGAVLTTSDQAFYTTLADSATLKWDFKLETGTFTDGVTKTCVVTVTASLS